MILIFNLSVSLSLDSRSPSGTTVPSPPAGGVFPSRGAFGKEISLFVDCQGLSYKERWHPEGMTERLYNLSPLCYTTLIQSRICGKL